MRRTLFIQHRSFFPSSPLAASCGFGDAARFVCRACTGERACRRVSFLFFPFSPASDSLPCRKARCVAADARLALAGPEAARLVARSGRIACQVNADQRSRAGLGPAVARRRLLSALGQRRVVTGLCGRRLCTVGRPVESGRGHQRLAADERLACVSTTAAGGRRRKRRASASARFGRSRHAPALVVALGADDAAAV